MVFRIFAHFKAQKHNIKSGLKFRIKADKVEPWQQSFNPILMRY